MATPLTDRGWPRPRIGGFPIPWAALPDNLGKTDGDRIIATKAYLLCQVCGFGFETPESTAVVFLDGGLKSKKPYTSVVLPEVLCRAMDDAIMHPRCARLSAGSCPRLKKLREEERFFAFSGPVDAIDEYDAPEAERDPERMATMTYVALDGARAAVFDI